MKKANGVSAGPLSHGHGRSKGAAYARHSRSAGCLWVPDWR
jgi:hypothetical protein